MTRADFLDHIEKLYASGIETIKRKNADYASGSDPFQNFNQTIIAGVSPERAILVRMADKLSRISNCLDKYDVQVIDEQVTDTLIDLINYAGILHAKLTDNKDKQDGKRPL